MKGQILTIVLITLISTIVSAPVKNVVECIKNIYPKKPINDLSDLCM